MTRTVVSQAIRGQADNIFFPATALLILCVVVVGFAPKYFMAGMIRAKLPNALVHVHAALFVSWILVLMVQTSLVAARRIKLHITLGVLGVILPPAMVVVGLLTMCDSLQRSGTNVSQTLLLIGDVEELVLFTLLTAWGMIVRRNAAAHKRLMVLGTMAMLGPAIGRLSLHNPASLLVIYLAIPLLMIVYDYGRLDAFTALPLRPTV